MSTVSDYANQIALQQNPEFAAAVAGASSYNQPLIDAQNKRLDIGLNLALKGMEQNAQDNRLRLQKQLNQQEQDRNELYNLQKTVAEKGADPSKITNLQQGLALLSRNSQPVSINVPQVGNKSTQIGGYSVPNMSQMYTDPAQDAYLYALTGNDLRNERQNVYNSEMAYRTDPNYSYKDYVNALNQLQDLESARIRQTKQPNSQPQMKALTQSPLDKIAELQNTLNYKNMKARDRYLSEYHQLPQWSKLPFAAINPDDNQIEEAVENSKKFYKETYDNLFAKGVHEIDKTVVDRMLGYNNFNYNPSLYMVVQDDGGELALYNTNTGEFVDIFTKQPKVIGKYRPNL